MAEDISSNAKKAMRVLREEGLISLLRKIKRRAVLRRLSQSQEMTDNITAKTGIVHVTDNIAEKWLIENRNQFSKPFFILLKHLMTLHEDLKDKPSLSSNDYENYFNKMRMTDNFPFEIPFRQVERHEDIVRFIYEYDGACLDRMVRSVFVGAIRHLTQEKGKITLLDFGTGPTCGMYGENGRFLFEEAKVNIGNITFFGIDDLHKPQGSIFKKATYQQCNILSFAPDTRFDFISGHHVLEHCYNWEDVLIHAGRLLKTGGYLYLSFPRFGGFYDTAYRLMSPFDHCANFDLPMLRHAAKSLGLEMCLSDIYVDPDNRFDWICNLYPDLVKKEMADYFYDLCVRIDSKAPFGFHHYGHYVVMRKTG